MTKWSLDFTMLDLPYDLQPIHCCQHRLQPAISNVTVVALKQVYFALA